MALVREIRFLSSSVASPIRLKFSFDLVAAFTNQSCPDRGSVSMWEIPIPDGMLAEIGERLLQNCHALVH